MANGLRVVEARFLHVDIYNPFSFKALVDECGEQAAEDLKLMLQGVEVRSPFNTVVRFFDTEDVVTDFVLRHLFYCGRAGRASALKKAPKNLAVRQFDFALRTAQQVAVERSDHTFRPIRSDEKHELLEEARGARYVRLFVFEPNNLLSTTNTSVAYAM